MGRCGFFVEEGRCGIRNGLIFRQDSRAARTREVFRLIREGHFPNVTHVQFVGISGGADRDTVLGKYRFTHLR